MAYGRFPCLPGKYILPLLMLLFQDVDTAREILHKEVGETAEFSVSRCVQGGNVLKATWNFVKDDVAVVEMDENVITLSDNPQFKGRVEMNNFTLTIKSLTRQDSGEYSFVSVTDKKQCPTIFITLRVHDSISKEPNVTEVSNSWHAENSSCLVSLECSAAPADNITYSWTVGNHTLKWGHRVNVTLLAEEGEATVNCSVTNGISPPRSASRTVSCIKPEPDFIIEPEQLFIIAIAAGTVCLLLAVALSVACYCKRRSAAGTDRPDTIYSTVSDNEVGSKTLENAIYESIEGEINLVTVGDGPQTLYDKINFNRPPVASTTSIPDVCQTPKHQVTTRP